MSPSHLLHFVEELEHVKSDDLDSDGSISTETAPRVFAGTPVLALSASGWDAAVTASATDFWKLGSQISSALGLQGKLPHLLVNGRVRLHLIRRYVAENPIARGTSYPINLFCRRLRRPRGVRAPKAGEAGP